MSSLADVDGTYQGSRKATDQMKGFPVGMIPQGILQEAKGRVHCVLVLPPCCQRDTLDGHLGCTPRVVDTSLSYAPYYMGLSECLGSSITWQRWPLPSGSLAWSTKCRSHPALSNCDFCSRPITPLSYNTSVACLMQWDYKKVLLFRRKRFYHYF